MVSFKSWFLKEVGDGGTAEPMKQLPQLFFKANPGDIRPKDYPPKGPQTVTSKYALKQNPNKLTLRPEPNIGLSRQG
jgi:hypothetical protein